jgi:O-antigen ligase
MDRPTRVAQVLWTTLLVLVVLRATLPDALDVWLRGYRVYDVRAAIALGRPTGASLAGVFLDLAVASIALLRIGQVALARQLRFPRGAGGLLLTAALVTQMASSWAGSPPGRTATVVCLTLIALLLSPPSAQRAMQVFLKVGLWSLIICWLMAAASPDLAWIASNDGDSRFALVSSLRLTGFFSHPNMLAYWALALAAVALMSPPGRVRGAALPLSVVTLLACGSRTALIAAGLVALLALSRLFGGRLIRVAVAGTLATLAAMPALGFVGFIDSAGRSEIWQRARSIWPEERWVGHGLDYWQTGEAQADGFPLFAYHAHNQLLDSLVLGGLVAGILVACYLLQQLFAIMRWNPTSGRMPALAIALLCSAISEVPVQFSLVDPRLVIVVMTAIVLSPEETPSNYPEDEEQSPDFGSRTSMRCPPDAMDPRRRLHRERSQ